MINFSFLQTKPEYAMFAPAAMEAEKVCEAAPAMCVIGCRKALELAVKWVYSADSTMQMPYKDNLQSLLHEPSFRFAVDRSTWGKLPFIVKLGKAALHRQAGEPGRPHRAGGTPRGRSAVAAARLRVDPVGGLLLRHGL